MIQQQWQLIRTLWTNLPELDRSVIRWRLAVITGVFCLIISLLLVLNFFQGLKVDPLQSKELSSMKTDLISQPANDKLKQQIRSLDMRLRQQHATHQARASWGGWLLLTGGIAFLSALKSVSQRKKLPRPTEPSLDFERACAARTRGQGAVALVGLALAGTAWYLAAQATTPLAAKKVEVAAAPNPSTPYPTLDEMKRNWPRFRGPEGSGISPYTNIVSSFNTLSNENVLWKTVIPLFGPNSPLVWENRVFLTGSTASRREVYCLDSLTGRILWQQPVEIPDSPKDPPSVMEETGGYSPSTGATDGRRVYTMFANGDVAAFDYQGKLAWARNLGKPDNSYGHAASVELYQDRLLIQFDQGNGKDKKSKLLALNTATGQTTWESQPRPVPNSWSTPLVIHVASKPQIITCANPWVIAYDPANGSEIWRAQTLYGEVTPSPIFAGGFVLSVMEGEKLSAIKPDGTGDVTKTHVAWFAEDGLPDICSPLSDGQRIYLLTSSGILTCYQLADGKKLWEKELDQSFNSSPSLVGDRLWVISDHGLLIQVAAGSEFKELGRTEIGEEVLASPAFANGLAIIRTKKHLFALGKNRTTEK
jgi:outer membrane protein assembly factor BamB